MQHFIKILFIILFFSITNRYLAIEIGHYTLHLYYIIFALLSICLINPIYTQLNTSRIVIKDVINISPYWLFFLFLSFSGLLSLLYYCYRYQDYSSVPHTLIYLIWTSGTLLFVIPVTIYFKNRYTTFVDKVLTLFLIIQSVVLFYDFIICNLQYSQFAIGFYIQNGITNISNFFLYRPHFLEGEPAYLVTYSVFLIAYFRVNILTKYRVLFKIPCAAIYIFLLFSIVLTTSRTGILSVVLLLLYDGCQLILRPYAILSSLKNQLKDARNKIISIVLLGVFLFTFLRFFYVFDIYLAKNISFLNKLSISETQLTKLNNNNNTNLIEIDTDKYFSVKERRDRYKRGFEIFKNNILLGVGAGNSYYHYNHFIKNRTKNKDNYNHPISLNLYTEMLAEWGVIGFILFLIGLVLLLYQKKKGNLFLYLSLFLVIALSGHTISRFNLWFSLALLYNPQLLKKLTTNKK